MFDQVTTYSEKKTAQKQKLSQDRQKQTELVAEAKAAKARVEEKLAERERLLKGKEREVAQLEKEEEERQAKLAAQAADAAAARQAAARAAASRQASSGSSHTSNNGSKPSNSGTTKPAYVPSSAVGSEAVQVAMQYLGVPYVWAGAEPEWVRLLRIGACTVYAQLGVRPAALEPGAVRHGAGRVARRPWSRVTWCSSAVPSTTWVCTWATAG